jgi:hypothetical protein
MGGRMDDEIDYDLSTDLWETLKMLRAPVSRPPAISRIVLGHLIALGLVSMNDDLPVITRQGRKALIRGSSRLWDVAA